MRFALSIAGLALLLLALLVAAIATGSTALPFGKVVATLVGAASDAWRRELLSVPDVDHLLRHVLGERYRLMSQPSGLLMDKGSDGHSLHGGAVERQVPILRTRNGGRRGCSVGMRPRRGNRALQMNKLHGVPTRARARQGR